ncbi:MAG: transglutaminase domain-containing protein [bacterium]|nr:transglutaminase domain-containing protein [bacterium]
MIVMKYVSLLMCLILAVALVSCGSPPNSSQPILTTNYSADIAAVLAKAGDNAPELQKILDHYAVGGDQFKSKAAQFLIANMGPHGFGEAGVFDKDGKEVHYDSLEYDNFKAALAARDALTAKHGKLTTKRKRYLADIETVKAQYLIEQIDQAFDAWRELPWASKVTFDTFCNYILPYRCSNEPINAWRKTCRQALAETLKPVKAPYNIPAISKLCDKQRGKWVKFDSKCYLHPTDQSFEQMRKSRFGRCEDLSNMQSYLNRANGIPMTSDYTPAWARGNNNHAWTIVLDGDGKAYPRDPMLGAAKVYRKMYAKQPDLPAFHIVKDETIPGWLRGKNYRDVTSEYRPTHDVTVTLTKPIGDKCTYAYLCVFNSGRWVAIAAGPIDAKTSTAKFPRVGGNIVYYPAYCVEKKLIPAGAVFTLSTDGTATRLDTPVKDDGPRITTKIRQTKNVDISPDTGKPTPAIKVVPNKKYELFYWSDKWISLGKQTAKQSDLVYDNLPSGRLYRMVETTGRNLERPFTINNGKQVLW